MRELKKQDRTSSRLPTDTERKYKLGQIELTKEELDKLKSELVIDEYLSITSPNAIANKTVTNALNNKVTKEEGKMLSSNDFTNKDKNSIHIHNNKAALDNITQENINGWNSNSSALGIYSTDEKAVGTWIDGKPLYRRVIVGRFPELDISWQTIATISPDLVIRKFDGTLGYMPFPCYTTSEYYINIQYNTTNGDILVLGKGYNNSEYNLIVEYTKTTD